MLYVLLTVLVMLVLFNVHASRIILRSKVNDASQKRRQLAFVWLLPLLGALVAVQVHKASRASGPGGGLVGMEYEQAWDYAGHEDNCSPDDPGCGE